MPRRVLDRYETPPHYVAPLLELTGSLSGLLVYEPCVGQGHLARYLTDARRLVTNDIDPTCAATTHKDACLAEAWPTIVHADDRFDWTITNPPFCHELAILAHALRVSRNVAVVARLSFLEPTQSRVAFWHAHPPSHVIVLPRYSFRVNDQGKRQTDTVTCVWIVYREGRSPCLTFSRHGGIVEKAVAPGWTSLGDQVPMKDEPWRPSVVGINGAGRRDSDAS